MKVVITTYPFGHTNAAPLKLLSDNRISFRLNKVNRKYTKEEHLKVLIEEKPDIIIAGTEKYDKDILDLVPNLKMIARVGIGLDSIPLKECKKRKIVVTYTPDAQSNAVAELTICQMLNMLRKVQNVSRDMMEKEKWNRYIGRELSNCTVGVIGYGRVGRLVCEMLLGFGADIYINDIDKSKIPTDEDQHRKHNCWYIEERPKNLIYKECDVITIHVPLKDDKVDNHNMITINELEMMKDNVRLLNLSRGGIINEEDLYKWLSTHPKATVAIDTFKQEPYRDKLASLGNAYLTPHLGSCTTTSRLNMELGAAQEVINFINKEPFDNRVI